MRHDHSRSLTALVTTAVTTLAFALGVLTSSWWALLGWMVGGLAATATAFWQELP